MRRRTSSASWMRRSTCVQRNDRLMDSQVVRLEWVQKKPDVRLRLPRRAIRRRRRATIARRSRGDRHAGQARARFPQERRYRCGPARAAACRQCRQRAGRARARHHLRCRVPGASSACSGLRRTRRKPAPGTSARWSSARPKHRVVSSGWRARRGEVVRTSAAGWPGQRRRRRVAQISSLPAQAPRIRGPLDAVRSRARISAAPSTIAPRQIPALIDGQRCRDEIEPRCSPGMTAAQPRQCHPSSGPQSEAADRLVGIGRAGRQMAAVKPDQRRESVAIDADQSARGDARKPCQASRHGARKLAGVIVLIGRCKPCDNSRRTAVIRPA